MESVQSDNNIKDFSNLNLKQKFAYAMRCITGDKNEFWLGKIDKWKSSESTLEKRGAKLVLSSPKERERVVGDSAKKLGVDNKGNYGNLDENTKVRLNNAAFKLKNGNIFQRQQAYKKFRDIEKGIMTDFENKKPLTETQTRRFGFGLIGGISSKLSIAGLEGEFYKKSEQPDADFNELKGTAWDFKPGNPPSLSVSKEAGKGEVRLQDIKFKSKTDENGNEKIIASFKDPINTDWVLEAEVPDSLFEGDLAKLKIQILNAGEGGCYIGEDGAVKPSSTESNNVEVPQEPDVPTNEGNNVQTLDGDQNTPEVQVNQDIAPGGEADESVIKECENKRLNSINETSATSQIKVITEAVVNTAKTVCKAIVSGAKKFGKWSMIALKAIGNAFNAVVDFGRQLLHIGPRSVNAKEIYVAKDNDNTTSQINNDNESKTNASIPTDPDNDDPIWNEQIRKDRIEDESPVNDDPDDPFIKDFEEGS